MSHSSPGTRGGPGGYPPYTSLMGGIKSSGARDSLQDLIEDLENMYMVSVVPRIDPRAMLIELDASMYSSS